jgi:hypothetical protein
MGYVCTALVHGSLSFRREEGDLKVSQPTPGLRENKKIVPLLSVRHNDGQWSFLKIDNNVNASATDCIVYAICRQYETIKQVRSSFIALATSVQSSPDAICSTYWRTFVLAFISRPEDIVWKKWIMRCYHLAKYYQLGVPCMWRDMKLTLHERFADMV